MINSNLGSDRQGEEAAEYRFMRPLLKPEFLELILPLLSSPLAPGVPNVTYHFGRAIAWEHRADNSLP